MKRFFAFIYGVICYVIFLVTFLYAIAFIANIQIPNYVPKTIDTGTSGPLTMSIVIDMVLLGIFALQHSIMARPGFKKWWINIVPKSVERSTYVLFSSLALILLFWQWRPITGPIWEVQAQTARLVLWSLYGLGMFIVLSATYMISHWHLFGLKQVTDNLKGNELSNPKFQINGYYHFVRHPLMLGFIIAFWAAPTMTVGHLLFAAAATGYILIALQLEEKDLIHYFGDKYLDYKKRVPGLIPVRFGGRNRNKIDESEVERYPGSQPN